MKIKYFQFISLGLMTIVVVTSLFTVVPVGYAQSSQTWSDPINLSKAGSSSNPSIIVDATGLIHVIWVDKFDGYKYSESKDGVEWTPPKSVKYPFSSETDGQPVFYAAPNGSMYVFWQNSAHALFSSLVAAKLDLPSSWTSPIKLADSVIAFGVAIDSQSNAHIGYASSLATATQPAGVFYVQLKGAVRSTPINLYSSQYFRSLLPEEASVHPAFSEKDKLTTLYMVWDDRLQKQIMMAQSLDGGSVWESPVTIRSSEDSSGSPYNINVGAASDNVLVLWQSGVENSQCSQFSEASTDGGQHFSSPEKMLDESAGCPKDSDFITLNKDFSVLWLNIYDDISLMAWNGTSWSKPQPQKEITTFINPATSESVIFGCQNKSVYNGRLFVVGCDKGPGGDIWFRSRSLGTIENWIAPLQNWTAPVEVTNINQQISELSTVSDSDNHIHSLWIQPSLLAGEEEAPTIQYSGWDGEKWSKPEAIFSKLDGYPVQLKVKADNQKRILIVWVNSKTGDMSFSWVGSDRAKFAAEWAIPQYIPSPSQANSSPDILVDDTGRIIIAYAVSINEERGIYFVESEDGGLTWTQPVRAFDAASAGWDVVDQPNITLTGDGRLHLLFRRFPAQGNPSRPLGLYYSQSSDGGATWSDAETVSEQPVLWSEIVAYGQSTLHRFWQEYHQAMLVSFDQISLDGGTTWSSPSIVSNINSKIILTTGVTDHAGNLHFLQLTSKENIITLDQQIWDGSSWTSQGPSELYIQDRAVPSSITAGVSSKGYLSVSILMDYPFVTETLKSSVISLGKMLDLSQEQQTPYPAIIPAFKPTVVATEAVSNTSQISTQVSDLNQIGDSPSSVWRNAVGILLIVGMLVLVVIIFRPLSKRQANQKKTSH